VTKSEFPDDHVNALIANERLPADFAETVEHIYRPLADKLAAKARLKTPLLVAVNGAQGTGKSTLSAFLSLLLTKGHDLPTVALSIDDLYLTRRQRHRLGRQVHPMLAVRGVPGTHDVDLGVRVIGQLSAAKPEDTTLLPAFDKAVDDRLPESEWPEFKGRPAVIILEGWCVGAEPQSQANLEAPLNELEARSDPDAVWRQYVNDQLNCVYPALFSLFDILIMIAAPSWDVVYEWRCLQEAKLRDKCQRLGLERSRVMTPVQLQEFVQYYERITRHCLAEMPARADYVLAMDDGHRITGVRELAWNLNNHQQQP
jgi:D-glycerate 3-kinase